MEFKTGRLRFETAAKLILPKQAKIKSERNAHGHLISPVISVELPPKRSNNHAVINKILPFLRLFSLAHSLV
ncbi:MAG: hypothetical protein WCS69_16685 [Ignavibacteriaceae bacterium]